jgi:type II secretory pathway pseudopilin PulG
MKISDKRKSNQSGFTAVEMVVSTTVFAILGIVFIQVLNSGMVLYAKNTAVNKAHQEARDGINRLTRDIHAAVSVPQLRNSTHDATYTVTGSFTVVSSAPVSGVAPTAAGVSFQSVVAGSPDYVWQDPNAPNLIMIKDNPNQPIPGMHLIVPFWGIEDDIIKVTASGTTNHSNVFLAGAGETTVVQNAPHYLGNAYAITYYTERSLYLVQNGTYIADSQGPWILSGGVYVAYTSGNMQRYRYENGELHLYKQRYSGGNNNSGYFYWQDIATIARYISSPQPFYIPLDSGGTPDTRYVGVKLSARDPSSSNRGYLATASLLDTQIDYRSRITLYQ